MDPTSPFTGEIIATLIRQLNPARLTLILGGAAALKLFVDGIRKRWPSLVQFPIRLHLIVLGLAFLGLLCSFTWAGAFGQRGVPVAREVGALLLGTVLAYTTAIGLNEALRVFWQVLKPALFGKDDPDKLTGGE
jgi:hypothetical protein